MQFEVAGIDVSWSASTTFWQLLLQPLRFKLICSVKAEVLRRHRAMRTIYLLCIYSELKSIQLFFFLSAFRLVVKRRRRRNGIYASLFGVGAPEALVIGVVALLVFGPKGLAEAARSLGKTLRAFQPTIRELQDVSRDFKNTLEREIGLDEDPPSMSYRPPPPMNNSQQPAVDQDVKPETTVPYTSEELMKVTEEQLAASAIAAWNAQQPPSSEQQEAAAATTPSESTDSALSVGSDGPGAVPEESTSGDC
ncbi:Sec-independent protein translocase protein tatA/E-like protein [Triticum urartu]|uniref:Sec-independent protein translocase protein tatA/E-like protein n=1 Tax=Triticum urartu TaxID=4572 RepID=M7YSR9_TRIUA|nr:Sec-independent protein translocase protein tatA/E-like protein [Triticum urartu]